MSCNCHSPQKSEGSFKVRQINRFLETHLGAAGRIQIFRLVVFPGLLRTQPHRGAEFCANVEALHFFINISLSRGLHQFIIIYISLNRTETRKKYIHTNLLGVPSYLISKSWQPSVIAQASTGIPGFLDPVSWCPAGGAGVLGCMAPVSGEPPDTSLVHFTSGT